MMFSYFFIRKVNLLAEFQDKCRNLPTLSSTSTISSILYPLRLSIRCSMHTIHLSTSTTFNFVNQQIYFMILLFLSLMTKLIVEVSLIFSYQENIISLAVYPMSRNFRFTIATTRHKYGVTRWYSFLYSSTSLTKFFLFFLLLTRLNALHIQFESLTFLQLSSIGLNSLYFQSVAFLSSSVTNSGIFSQIYLWNQSQKIDAFSALSIYLAIISLTVVILISNSSNYKGQLMAAEICLRCLRVKRNLSIIYMQFRSVYLLNYPSSLRH